MPHHLTVGEALERVLAGDWDSAEEVWTVDGDGRPLGCATLVGLLRAEPGEPLASVTEPAPPAVTPATDQEHVALHAIRHRLSTVPVLDDAGRLAGGILPDALLRILRHEHVEDLHRLAGIAREPQTHESIDEPPARRAWHRLPWLLVGLLGSALATWTVASYQTALEHRVALGFFIPGLVYLADAIGTQAETLAVRRLSRERIPFRSLMSGELGTGLVIGAVLAVLGFAAVWVGFGTQLAAIVGSTIVVSSMVATGIGISLPWILSRLGKDPALGSGPLATVIQDCLTVLVYFAIAVRVGS